MSFLRKLPQIRPRLVVSNYYSIQILGNNQLDALFHVLIYFMSLHVSSVTVLIIRRSNCINTSSGIVTAWYVGQEGTAVPS